MFLVQYFILISNLSSDLIYHDKFQNNCNCTELHKSKFSKIFEKNLNYGIKRMLFRLNLGYQP